MSIFARLFGRPRPVVLYERAVLDAPAIAALKAGGYLPVPVFGRIEGVIQGIAFPQRVPPAQVVPCKACDGTGKRPMPDRPFQCSVVDSVYIIQGICVACHGRGTQLVDASKKNL